ncbi:MAG: amino acid ABC transporter permease [Spirochaetales bacterium]|nr:amino acid ABC transporter permease [Spirochaetales bacterium]
MKTWEAYTWEDNILELLVYGIVLGSIISLGAIGLSLIYGILNFANFAHGEFMAGGAYITFFLISGPLAWIGVPDTTFGSLSFGWRLLISFPISMAAVGGLAIFIDRALYRKLRRKGAGRVMLAMSALGASFIIRMIILIIWGPDFLFYRPGVLRPALMLPFGIKIRPDQLVILVAVMVLVFALHLFLQRTKLGKAMRATADNMDLALISGINIERIIVITWIIGGGLAAAAGILYAVDVQLHPALGWNFLLPLFAATILGSIGNIYGAFVGGLIIGIIQQLSTAIILPTYKPAVAFLIMIIILLIKPQGIFGKRGRL